MKQLVVNKKHYSFPEKWQELSKNQFLKIAFTRLNFEDSDNETEYQATRIILFKILSGVPDHIIAVIEPVQWLDLLPHVNWTLEVPTYTTNPIPIIRYRSFFTRKTLFGPIDLLRTSSFKEFREADQAFLNFTNNKNWDSIWLLMAILWRPKRKDISDYKTNPMKWDGDVREPLNLAFAKRRALIYKHRIPQYYAIAVFLYYLCARDRALIKNTLLQPLFRGSSKPSKLGWFETLLEMSNTKFGTAEQTDEENWLVILVEMARQIELSERIKQANKPNK